MGSGKAHPNYFAIWVGLVALAIIGVAASYLPVAKPLVIFLIFLVAASKAVLVGCYYMHLKTEGAVIYTIAFVPVVLAAIMTIILFPDFVFHHH
jgi:cytochrome c oxidase subunit 4